MSVYLHEPLLDDVDFDIVLLILLQANFDFSNAVESPELVVIWNRDQLLEQYEERTEFGAFKYLECLSDALHNFFAELNVFDGQQYKVLNHFAHELFVPSIFQCLVDYSVVEEYHGQLFLFQEMLCFVEQVRITTFLF